LFMQQVEGLLDRLNAAQGKAGLPYGDEC
jgi:hypothetical protein